MNKNNPDITPTHPDTGSGPGPGLGYQLVHDLDALMAQTSAPEVAELLLDTETLGLGGVAFLLQLSDPAGGPPVIIRVRDHAPADILRLIRALARPGLTLVGHNLTFDLAKLIHLATVASILAERGQGWTEEAVWAAESIWRPGETTFEDRLKHIQMFWPDRVIDTLVAAHMLPPFGGELQRDPCIIFRKLPVAIVPALAAKFAANLNKSGGGVDAAWGLGNHVQWTWADTPKPTAAEKRRRAAAIKYKDFRVLGDVKITIRVPSPYSLKTLAPLLGYTGPVQKQDFEGIFGDADTASPVWLERGGPSSKECGHQDAWQKSLELERDETMLSYAADDINMLRVVYNHYRAQPQFSALEHDMALVPWAAAVRMFGIHVDEAAHETARQAYRKNRDEGVAHSATLGLKNINSADQVIDYVNDHVIKPTNLNLPPGEDDEELEEIENARRKDTLEPLQVRLKALIEQANPQQAPALAQALENLQRLMEARIFDKRLQFIETICGDSVFPLFHVTGTQTDRMTCTNPNSQQMPNPDSEADWDNKSGQATEIRFREMFTPPAGYTMHAGDFDQLELRIKSGLTKDPFTQAIYAKETDADPADEHSENALKIFGAELHKLLPGKSDAEILALLKAKDKAVKHYRSKVKPIGFGIPYGASEYGIARNAGCTVEEAQEMLEEYWKLCPVTRAAIEAVHRTLTMIEGDDGPIRVHLPKAHAVTNRMGLSRSFTIAQRMVYLAGKMADKEIGGDGFTYLQRAFPELAQSPAIVTRGKDRATGLPQEMPVLSALRSALRGGAFSRQKALQRQAFNFLIQSSGAWITKMLQTLVYTRHYRPGMHKGLDLSLLPGLQVHDEIHLFLRHGTGDAAVQEQLREFLPTASQTVGCPIRFAFTEVPSWAAK